jgi:hypothetical protein
MEAIGVGMVTLVAYIDKDYPTDRGNCFSVIVEKLKEGEELCHAYDRISRRVVNVHYENFKELLKRGILSWPVEVEELDERHCAIIDDRLPVEWKLDHLCETCTPEALREKAARYLQRFCSECGAELYPEDDGPICDTCVGEHERGVRVRDITFDPPPQEELIEVKPMPRPESGPLAELFQYVDEYLYPAAKRMNSRDTTRVWDCLTFDEWRKKKKS